MWSLAGSRAVDQPICCFRLESRGAASPAAFVLSHRALRSPVLNLWVGQLASPPDAHPPEVSGVGSQSASLHVRNWSSGEHQGCLSCSPSRG